MSTLTKERKRKRNPKRIPWRAAIEHHKTQIHRYENTISKNGQVWLNKMIKFHERELKVLTDNPPPVYVDL